MKKTVVHKLPENWKHNTLPDRDELWSIHNLMQDVHVAQKRLDDWAKDPVVFEADEGLRMGPSPLGWTPNREEFQLVKSKEDAKISVLEQRIEALWKKARARNLNARELLGLSMSASVGQIVTAYTILSRDFKHYLKEQEDIASHLKKNKKADEWQYVNVCWEILVKELQLERLEWAYQELVNDD